MILTFPNPDTQRAATHLIANSCLAWLPESALYVEHREPFRLFVTDDWRWSSGEKAALIPLLRSISSEGFTLRLGALREVDTKTAAACVEAIAIAAGFGANVKEVAA